MVQFGTTWCSLVQLGADWCSLVEFAALWCSLVQLCASWVHIGADWCTLVHIGATWGRLVQCGADGKNDSYENVVIHVLANIVKIAGITKFTIFLSYKGKWERWAPRRSQIWQKSQM